MGIPDHLVPPILNLGASYSWQPQQAGTNKGPPQKDHSNRTERKTELKPIRIKGVPHSNTLNINKILVVVGSLKIFNILYYREDNL